MQNFFFKELPTSRTDLTKIQSALLAQWLTFCQEQEQDLENVASSTPVQSPGTLFHLTFTTSLIWVHSENDSRVYFLIVLITDYCWCSWKCYVTLHYIRNIL